MKNRFSFELALLWANCWVAGVAKPVEPAGPKDDVSTHGRLQPVGPLGPSAVAPLVR